MNADLAWGLQMTVIGMGTVFLLLIVLMLILMGFTRLDRPPKEDPAVDAAALTGADDDTGEPADTRSVAVTETDGLDPDILAAIAVAVLAEDDRHRQPALATGSTPGAPQSHWVAVGRAQAIQPWRRR